MRYTISNDNEPISIQRAIRQERARRNRPGDEANPSSTTCTEHARFTEDGHAGAIGWNSAHGTSAG